MSLRKMNFRKFGTKPLYVFCAALAVFALLLGGCVKARELVLLDGKKTDYQIVIPDASESARVDGALQELAEVMQLFFAENGARIEIVSETAHNPSAPSVYLGKTRFARGAGIDFDQFSGWDFVIRAEGQNLILAGNDGPHPLGVEKDPRSGTPLGIQVPTTKAVADFLFAWTGTRFLYPGKIGIAFGKTERVEVPADLNLTKSPILRYNFEHKAGRGAVEGILNGDLYLIANNYFPNTEFDFTIHSWDAAIPAEKYGKTNPEYFALVKGVRTVEDPARTTKAEREHYNIGNPAVRERIYEFLLESLDSGYRYAVVGQQDGFIECESPESRDLYGTGSNWTEKIWRLNLEIAERLAKERPDAKVIFSSYGQTWAPPEGFSRFPDNSIIMLTRSGKADIEPWKQKEVPGGFAAYVYNWGTYALTGYTPGVYPEYVVDQARRLADLGVQGVYIDGFGYSFGLDGPTYYAFGRTFDDPETASATSLVQEFCMAAFGDHAGPMEKFYSLLYGCSQKYTDAMDSFSSFPERMKYTADTNRLLASLYPEETLAEMRLLLDPAGELSPKEKVRMDLVRLEFDYLLAKVQVARRDIEYRDNPTPDGWDRLVEAIRQWRAVLDGIYEGGNHPKRIPDFVHPFSGHSRWSVALERNQAYRRYAESPHNWDPEQLKKTDVPEAPVLVARREQHTENPAPAQTGTKPPPAVAYYSTDSVTFEFSLDKPMDEIELVLRPEAGLERYFRFRTDLRTGHQSQAALGLVEDNLDPRYGKEDDTWSGEWSVKKHDGGTNKVSVSIPFQSLGVDVPDAGDAWRVSFRVLAQGQALTPRPGGEQPAGAASDPRHAIPLQFE